MFIVDFDDTLFSTHDFKSRQNQTLREVGVSEEETVQSYFDARNSNTGNFVYSNRRRAEVLALKGYDEEKIFSALEKTTTHENLKSFLLPSAIDFLSFLREQKQPMILCSLGDPNFQEIKVKGCEIEKYFDRMFMVQDTKEHVLRELFTTVHPSETIWFFNDKVKETAGLLVHFPFLRVVLKQSDSIDVAEYEQSGLPYFKTLLEIQTYVTEHNTI